MYLRWIVDLSPQREASRKIAEIVERNRDAKSKVLQLRRKLLGLETQAVKAGIWDSQQTSKKASQEE